MPIDLTDKVIQSNGAPKRPVKLHPIRRAVQLLLGALIIVCPLFNIMRLDLRAADFWVLGHRYSSQHVILFFWGGALLALTLFAVSLIYGRWWCGWVCPQTLASDFGDSVKTRLVRAFRGKTSPQRHRVALGVWAVVMVVASVVTAALLGSYFIAPAVVWSSLVHPTDNPGVAIGTYFTAALMAGNLLAVRRKFCASVCPYGLFLSIAGDRNTMTVRYLNERASDCIECAKCVTICPMSIDIRKGVNQPECIGCGECVDACNDILPRLKEPVAGLIEYRYGEQADRVTRSLPIAKRLGLWDGKRGLLIGSVVVMAAGLAAAALGVSPTTLSVTPSGQIQRVGGDVIEHYTVSIDSGYPGDVRYRLQIEGPSNVTLVEPTSTVAAEGKARTQVTLTLRANIAGLSSGTRLPVRLIAHSSGAGNTGALSARIIVYVP
ncbi:MAG TPA: 4Fe-4S dicluster domain-containing protein [Capsulimonadaceae bacterium]|jgi:cytochrome c oxidase accessory protein FixG